MKKPIFSISSESRRALLRKGLAAGAFWGLQSAISALAAESLPLIRKRIPSTGELLPAIGLGTIWFREAQAADLAGLIARMVEQGGSVIDTAAAYGESEAVIGQALTQRRLRSKVFLASKFDAGGTAMPPMPGAAPGAPLTAQPMPGPPPGVTRPERDGVGGEASFERSLQRLGTDHLDLLQVHGLNGTDTLMPLLQKWKRAKRIRYLGVTTSSVSQHAELMAAMRRYPLDFIQVDYSIGNRAVEADVLPLAIERKIGVLVNLPLGRATLLQKLADKPLPDWAGQIDVTSWGQFLLKYVIGHPAVTCAIPGSLQLQHLEDNQRAAHGRLPDAAMRARMAALFDQWSNNA